MSTPTNEGPANDSLPEKKSEASNPNEETKETSQEVIPGNTDSGNPRHPKFVIELHLKEGKADTG